MTRVAILWHMHQPYYEDLVTREHILPWVRLHALKDYYGMVALLDEFPGVRLTFNLVPSLLVQLEAFAAGRARDRYLELGLKAADALTADERVFILQNFFHAQRQRMIDIYPRYAELLARRGNSAQAEAAARRFDVEDFRDLQVWQKLAWIDPYYQDDSRVRRLVEQGRQFTEDDKAMLRTVELEILNRVIPAYRAAAATGRVELSASPFYHPILPLLCDSDIYLRTHPASRMPRQRFIHPEDAREQLERASACLERLFGARPVGLWPSEGSVSDAMAPLVAEAGFTWMATDELILARTLGTHFSRDADGRVDQPERLYVPYRLSVGGGDNTASINCLFRDHALSDRIGFDYAGWPADAAADDFVARLVDAGRRFTERTGGGEATIPIILDGENAWEHFEGGGRPFLRALYSRLSNHPELRTVTMAEACAGTGDAPGALETIFPGSWIDANFYIWIGHEDDQRAWDQLADARAVLDTAAADASPGALGVLARAREEVLIAEGSDWFWWYGDDHSSDHDLEFDDLFRRHLRNVYRLLEKSIPDELFVSNISAGALAAPEAAPIGLVTPVLDGEETSYFEWVGAGMHEVKDAAGAMHQSDRRASLLTVLWFGFDRSQFYLRVDANRPLGDLLAEGYRVAVTFLQPEGARVLVHRNGLLGLGKTDVIADVGHVTAELVQTAIAAAVAVGDSPPPRAAAGTVLEVAVPLASLGCEAGAPVAFFVALLDESDHEVERHPPFRPIETNVPDAWFEARNWNA
jgi:alpha-amylase/alpha-mannosidase (GH57 family)